jgi:hypothetical protein
MRKIILEEKDIVEFEQRFNSMPVFARNIAENEAVSHGVRSLLEWLSSKIVQEVPEAKAEK